MPGPPAIHQLREHRGEVDGVPLFWRSAPHAGEATPLYLHGVPTSSEDWLGFLRLTGGLAPDLPGFGRSGKSGSRSYTIAEYDTFIERFLETTGTGQVSLVVHDWGAVGLAFAQRLPERVHRLVIVDAIPFLPGYRWHRIARMWRTPGLGELLMGTTNRFTLRLLSREFNATPGPMPPAWIEQVLAHFDHGTQRAILRLYRSSPASLLAQAGSDLSKLTMPALVAWGMRDPYIPSSFAAAYADALGGSVELYELQDAGHWPWLDRPDLVERVARFLTAERAEDADDAG